MIEIADAGPQTTVQDLGRFGQLRNGIPPAGALDRVSFVLANRLVGNDDGAAGLECTLLGPKFQVDEACAVAVTGAEAAIRINGADAPGWTTLLLKAGDSVKVGAARSGVRLYIAFSGGIDVPPVLGSRSTYLRGELGGFAGRAVRKGDRVQLCSAAPPRPWHIDPGARPVYDDTALIRVVLGPQAGCFTDNGIRAFLDGPYRLLPQSDRMGARLHGERIEHTHGHDIISDGIALGSVQVPGDGQPIVLLVDRQSTGGYAKLATVCSFDIGRIGQLRPGQSLRFQAIEVGEAHQLLRDADRRLAQLVRPEGI